MMKKVPSSLVSTANSVQSAVIPQPRRAATLEKTERPVGVAGIRTLDGSIRFSISAIAWLTASSWNRQFLSVSTAYISSNPSCSSWATKALQSSARTAACIFSPVVSLIQ